MQLEPLLGPPQAFEETLDEWMSQFHGLLNLEAPGVAERDPEKEGVLDALKAAVRWGRPARGSGTVEAGCSGTWQPVGWRVLNGPAACPRTARRLCRPGIWLTRCLDPSASLAGCRPGSPSSMPHPQCDTLPLPTLATPPDLRGPVPVRGAKRGGVCQVLADFCAGRVEPAVQNFAKPRPGAGAASGGGGSPSRALLPGFRPADDWRRLLPAPARTPLCPGHHT